MGLFREMYRESLRLGLEYWLAAMDDSLWNLLKRFGFEFTPIGEPIEYYGSVVPYAICLEHRAANLAQHRPDVLRFVVETSRGRTDH